MATEVEGKVSAGKTEFKWYIDNFSEVIRNNAGGSFSSPIFTTTCVNKNIQCFLTLYPNGITQEHSDYVSLYLHAKGKFRAFKTFFEIQNNNGMTSWTLRKEEAIIGNKEGLGFEEFILTKHILVLDDIYLLDGKKTIIVCKIWVSAYQDMEVEEDSALEEDEKVEKTRLAEIDKYEVLINDEKFSDVSLISEGKTLKLHKCILAKSSPVFAAMFDADMLEKKKNTVEIEDIEHDVLLELIRFAYAGKVNNIDAIAGELAAAADEYAMDGLKLMCEKSMCENLSVGNVLLCLELADRHSMHTLKKMGIELFVAHADDVTSQPEFKLLNFVLMSEICHALVYLKNFSSK